MKFSYFRVFFFLFLGINIAKAQDWNQILKASPEGRDIISSAGRNDYDYFGYSVTIYGDYAVVGVPKEDDDDGGVTYTSSGAAVIFKKINENWTQIKKVRPNDRFEEDQFGYSVSINNDVIIIGAPYKKRAQYPWGGAVYIFYKNFGGTDNWGQFKKIEATEPNENKQFGSSIAINGDNIVVGAQMDRYDQSGNNLLTEAGAAYIFNKNSGGVDNWGVVKKIVASDRSAGDKFGYSVSISNNTIVIGANQEDEDANGINTVANAGSAYIYEKDFGGTNNWGQTKKIVSSDRNENDNFGNSVSIYDNYIVVGALNDDHDSNGLNYLENAGSAYIYKRDFGGTENWGQFKKICASNRATRNAFGGCVNINGENIIVGAAEGNYFNDAKAFLYNVNNGGTDNWGLVKEFTPVYVYGDGITGFGKAVAIYQNQIIIGAYLEGSDLNSENVVSGAGGAYISNKDKGSINNWGLENRIIFNDSPTNQYFGKSVAIDGDYAVMGSMNDPYDENGNNPKMYAGSVYIYKNINGIWTKIKKITPSDRNYKDYFGTSVAINNNTIVVFSKQYVNYNSGVVYIYEKDAGGVDNWGEVKKIIPLNSFQCSGKCVSIDNNIIVIGNFYDSYDENGANYKSAAGAIYLYEKDFGGVENWGQVKKIVPFDRMGSDFFGYSVSITNDNIIVGATKYPTGGSGAAYIFNKNVGGPNYWGLVKKISGSDSYGEFGYSVAISDDIAIVGGISNDAAYIFSKDFNGIGNWGQVKKIMASDRARYEYFGSSVSIYLDQIIVGAYWQDYDINMQNYLRESGAAYIYSKDYGGLQNWGQTQKIVASDRTAVDHFGYSVAINNNNILIGAEFQDKDENANLYVFGSGSAYFFKGSCENNLIANSNTVSIGNQSATLKNYFNANCRLITKIIKAGLLPITGHVNTKAWIENTQPLSFVNRHYEINPLTNSNTSTGKITLYFKQNEFDNYNSLSFKNIPINSIDLQGKANLRIIKYSGTSSDGSGLPNTYSGSPTIINPADEDIVWNETAQRWEVTFDTVGFGGFFVRSGSICTTTKSGDWNDPTVWSCGVVPTNLDDVIISPTHIITMPDNYTGQANNIENNGNLIFGQNASLNLTGQ